MRLLEMITKFVSTILLFILIWATSNSGACICPENIKSPQSSLTSCQSLDSVGDLCAECGHTRSCCSSHQEVVMTTGCSLDLPESILVITSRASDIAFAVDEQFKHLAYLRAPPLSVPQVTPVASKQVLLI